ncbi:glycoside hydrolase family 2 TIM barrel-domain containing protein [soil metagenome]
MAEQRLTAWRLKDFDLGQGQAQQAFAADTDGADWIDIAAPGDVYLALHAAGRLPDPFSDRAEQACAWVKDREWWQVTQFTVSSIRDGQHVVLDFQGLDTLAQVWLNGEVIGRSDNMFRPLVLDITALAKVGANRLAVCFTPTSTVVLAQEMPLWSGASDPIRHTKRNLVRKAQFGWGWDWGPTFPTVGIWAPATLRTLETAILKTVQFSTLELSPTRDQARVSVAVTADGFTPGDLSAEVVLTGPDGAEVRRQALALTAGAAIVEWSLDNPQLWWTPELGAANLHTLSVMLTAGGTVVDTRTLKVGVRTIGLDTSPDPDEPGASFFRFILNGAPIFARGACWIPASSFVATVDEPHYRRLLEMAAGANMNMVRVWGGGVYEHEAFYDLCDELGLLVWQDFMFACAPYPESDPAFVDNVRQEVRAQVQRLRHHASLALWCGNNECQQIGAFNARQTKSDAPLLGALYYDQIMPREVAALDPNTPYWPGSPSGGPNPNSGIAGDVHNWTVWHGVPMVPVDRPVGRMDITPEGVAYTRYAEDMTRFCSEYGIQASPVMETLHRALPVAERHYGGEALAARIKDRPKNKVDAMLIPVTGLPETLDEYVDFTQITQAEGLKFGIEHFRRRTPHCSGSLIWQFNDCWPGISWSLVDYYGFAKASYYYTKRAYAPVMASFQIGEDSMELWVVNDTLDVVEGAFTVALSAFSGGQLWAESGAYSVGSNQSVRVWQGKVAAEADQVLTVTSPDERFPANRLLLAPIKDLDRAAPAAPQVNIVAHDDHLAVTVTAADYLYFVHLLVSEEAIRFSDNYFDLCAGETRTIRVRHPAKTLTPADITVRWR